MKYAFPTNALNTPFHEADDDKHLGMSLRDWFASVGASALLSDPSLYNGAEWPKMAASDAYKFADAMLAEREKPCT